MTNKTIEAGTPLTAIANAATQPAANTSEKIAETILGPIDWLSATEGYCDCPGRNRHSNKNGRRDCVVYLDMIPTVHCMHSSCSSVVNETNKKLRAAVLNGKPSEARRTTAEDKDLTRERENSKRIRLRAAKSVSQVLSGFDWPCQQIITDSPTPVTGNETEHWKLLLRKFAPDDVVWIGDKCDSGKPEMADRFKTVTEWLKYGPAPAPFICPVAFKNSSFARSNENVMHRRFLVVESDTLSRDQVGAVFRWLREKCELNLAAIVDTGGKSLHAWFAFEDCEDELSELKLVLPAMQCDPKLFTASQPVRLPGVLRDGVAGKYQKLVYLSKEVTCE